MTKAKIGIDVGGTFTDFYFVGMDGITEILKVPTDQENPTNSVLDGIMGLSYREVRVSDIGHFVHGTTIALNTLLQRKGARVGLIVTKGFEDLLEIGRARLPTPNNIYADKFPPLVPRNLVRGIEERLLKDGSVYVPLNEDMVLDGVAELVELGIEALAICYLYSFLNETHENRSKELLESNFPKLYICTSSEIWPQQREYERGMLATINAHIGGQMRRYYNGLTEKIRSQEIRATVFSTKSNGGVMTATHAAERPVETLISGPAAGVVGAAYIGINAGFNKLITLDIGGTSADVSIIDDEFSYTTDTQVGEFPIIIPAVEASSIGAGGGSIARVDEYGILKVGPESAASDPGPACYGRGGTQPTITDAYLVNNWLDPDQFLGGTQRLSPELAHEALSNLGDQIGLSTEKTAYAVLEVATSNMYAQLMPLLARAGVDVNDFALLTYGGAGPTHGFMLANELNIQTVIVPAKPGLLCAFGCLVADLKADFIRTLLVKCADIHDEYLLENFMELEGQAKQWLSNQQAEYENVSLIRSADMRYVGQSFEINVPLANVPLDEEGLGALHHTFHQTYHQVYKTSDPAVPIEVVNIRAQIIGYTNKPTLEIESNGFKEVIPEKKSTRAICLGEQDFVASIFDRNTLSPGTKIGGPCVIEQYDTTTVVPPNYEVEVDRWGNLVAQRM